MIVVKIEMWPLGNEKKAYTLGRMHIANDGTGTVKHGNYKAAVRRKGCEEIKPKELFFEKSTRLGRVDNYPRKSYNVWRLIIRALLSCFPEERKNDKQ